MSNNWPPADLELPVFDADDLRLTGWDVGQAAEEKEVRGCGILQTGRCGDHFALVFKPGSYIKCGENGELDVVNVIFTGSQVTHERECPTA